MILFKRMHIQPVSDVHPFKGAPGKSRFRKIAKSHIEYFRNQKISQTLQSEMKREKINLRGGLEK